MAEAPGDRKAVKQDDKGKFLDAKEIRLSTLSRMGRWIGILFGLPPLPFRMPRLHVPMAKAPLMRRLSRNR